MKQLHDYQIFARDFLREKGRAALFLDMGLGKTATSLSAIEPRHLPVLVIAPKRPAEYVWPEEQEQWRPDLTLAVASGGPAAREAVLRGDHDITVLGRDNIKDISRLGLRGRWNTVILDELSGFKSRDSVRFKEAKQLGETYMWGLTGTPMPNGYMDLWSQVYLLDKGERLHRYITSFRSRYFMVGRQLSTGVVTDWVLRPESKDAIQAKIEDICLSMGTEGRVALPPVTFNQVRLELPDRVRSFYRQMEKDLILDLRDVFGDGDVHTAANAAVLTSKLSQVTSGFIFRDGGEGQQALHSVKIDAIREIREETHSPILVFYRFRPEKDELLKLPGAVSITEPDAIKSWNRGEVSLLVAHPASAGHGLNLQFGGHTIVWTSLDWSLELWLQANKRLARQGQKNPVVIHVLQMDQTVDGDIYARLQHKDEEQIDLLTYLEARL